MRRWRRNREISVEVISFLFMIVLAFAGVTKLLEGDSFFNNLNNSPILPDISWMAYLISWAVPTLEIVVALLIAIPRTRLKRLYAFLGLMIPFTIYVTAIVFFSPYTPCSCGEIISLLSSPQHPVLNIGLIILAVIAIRSYYNGVSNAFAL